MIASVNFSSRGSHTTRLVAKQIRLEDRSVEPSPPDSVAAPGTTLPRHLNEDVWLVPGGPLLWEV